MNNADFVAEARRWIGVRWRHQGRTREGIDCVGLPVVCAAAVRGMQIPLPDYSATTSDETMLRGCQQYLEQIALADAQPGDIVVLGFQKQRHMAILGDYPGGGLSLIHAYLPNRKVVEMRLDDAWRGRILSVFRLPEIA
jgi:cell wall-associated NlpC family hydrolase